MRGQAICGVLSPIVLTFFALVASPNVALATPSARALDELDPVVRAKLNAMYEEALPALREKGTAWMPIVREQAQVAAVAAQSARYEIEFLSNVYGAVAPSSPLFGSYYLTGITVDSNGTVYLTNDINTPCAWGTFRGDPLVYRVRSDGNTIALATWDSMVLQPFVFFPQSPIDQLVGQLIINVPPCVGLGNVELRGIAIDSTGDLFLCDPYLNTIFRLGQRIVDPFFGMNDVNVFDSAVVSGGSKLDRLIPPGAGINGCLSQPTQAGNQRIINQSGADAWLSVNDSSPNGIFIGSMKVYVDIRHDKVGDLRVTLLHIAPDASVTGVVLRNREGGTGSNIIETFQDPVLFSNFIGQNTRGEWRLVVNDLVADPVPPDGVPPFYNYIRCFWIEFMGFGLQGPTNLVFRRDANGNTSNLLVANTQVRSVLEYVPDSPTDPDPFPESVSLLTSGIPPNVDINPIPQRDPPGYLSLAQGLGLQRSGRATGDLFYANPDADPFRIDSAGNARIVNATTTGSFAWEIGADGRGGDELFTVSNRFGLGAIDSLHFDAAGQVSRVETIATGFTPPILLAAHPQNDSMYVAESYTGNVFRLKPIAAQQEEDIVVSGGTYTLQQLSTYLQNNPAAKGSLTRITNPTDAYESWLASGNITVTNPLAHLVMSGGQKLLFRDDKRLIVRNGGRVTFRGRSQFEGQFPLVPAEMCALSSYTAYRMPSAARPGLWNDIQFDGSTGQFEIGRSLLYAVVVEYANRGVELLNVPVTGSREPGVNRQSRVTLHFCKLRNNHTGLFVDGSSPLVQSCRIYNNDLLYNPSAVDGTGVGIFVRNTNANPALPLIFNSDIYGNEFAGVQIWVRTGNHQIGGPLALLGQTTDPYWRTNGVTNRGLNNLRNNGTGAQRNLVNLSSSEQTAHRNYWGLNSGDALRLGMTLLNAIDLVIVDDDEDLGGMVDYTGYAQVPFVPEELEALGLTSTVPDGQWSLYE